MGTILRSADAMGAQIVLVSKDTCDVYSGKVVRAAMGSLLHLPVCEIDSVPQAADMLHSRGIKLTAGHLKGTKASFEADLTGPVCLMIGNDAQEDMAAAEIGMKVFLMTDDLINKEGRDISVYPNGDLDKAMEYVYALTGDNE